MKKLFVISIISLASLATFAQKGASKIGVKAGVTFPKYSYDFGSAAGGTYTSDANTSFFIGAYSDSPISSNFSFQPGLSLIGKGGKTSGSGLVSTSNVLYLEVPLNFIANFAAGPGKVFVGAGPYAAYALSGKDKITMGSSSDNTNLKFGNSSSDDQKALDFGINLTAGYQLTNGFNINAGYGLGLANLIPKPTNSEKVMNRVLSIGIGFAY